MTLPGTLSFFGYYPLFIIWSGKFVHFLFVKRKKRNYPLSVADVFVTRIRDISGWGSDYISGPCLSHVNELVDCYVKTTKYKSIYFHFSLIKAQKLVQSGNTNMSLKNTIQTMSMQGVHD